MRKYLITISLLFFSFTLFAAQSLVSVTADGSRQSIALNTILKITITGATDKGFTISDNSYNVVKSGVKSIIFDENTMLEENTNEVNIAVYPNPVAEYLTIQNIDDNVNWRVIGMSGTSVMNGTGVNVDVTKLSNGLYLLVVDNVAIKFIKK